MITEIAVERIELSCPESHAGWTADYDVVQYQDPDGGLLEFYSLDGVPTPSPYTVDGAPLCPKCGRAMRARPVARRDIPVPPGDDDRPRAQITDPGA